MMHDKYKNKYRIKSHRMPGWDYSGNGLYFITLVTQNRECCLGEICHRENGMPYVKLSDFGKIVDNEWKKSFEMRDELNCDEYIIMPNHLHAIIVLKKPIPDNCHDSTDAHGLHGSHGTDDTRDMDGSHGSHESHGSHVETHGRASLPFQRSQRSHPSRPSGQRQPFQQSPKSPQSVVRPRFYRKPKSISSFVGGFKSAINSKIDDYIDEHKLNIPKYNRNNHFFQPNYHDHIIRNENEYYRIKNYIINNPLHWNGDKFKPSNSGQDQ